MDDLIEVFQSTESGHGRAPSRQARRAHHAAQRRAVLARTIETDIVPRLLLAHHVVPLAADDPHPGPESVSEMTDFILAHDISGARALAERVFESGISAEAIVIDLLGGSARCLGEMWCDDTCDFVAVSLGTWHLQQMLHEFAPRFRQAPAPLPPGYRALLVAMPGEQHTFGIAIVAAFFRAAGWSVVSLPLPRPADVVDMVRSSEFGLLGVSLSSETQLPALSAMIRSVRRCSSNPAIGILVGGVISDARPDLVRLVGADIAAGDARSAPRQAQHLMSLLAASH